MTSSAAHRNQKNRYRRLLPLTLSLCLLGISSCGDKTSSAAKDGLEIADPISKGSPPQASQVVAKPLASRGSDASAISNATRFTALDPKESGLHFVNPLISDHPMNRLYAGGYAVGGLAIGDVNGDALPDVYCVSGPERDRLFIQTSPLKFEDRTEEAGLSDSEDAWDTGVAMVDIDGDADLDLYVCRYDAPNALFVNDGEGRFEERAAEFGVDIRQASLMPTFCDYDRDGDLDLYILTNLFYREGGMTRDATFMSGNNPVVKAKYRKWIGIRPVGASLTHKRYELYPVGQRDLLLRNDGEQFKDVSGYVGDIGVAPGKGLSATWWDYNKDGFPDLYVCNDFEDADHFYHNNGDGTFTDIIKDAMPHTPWYSMGSDVADFDQDGRLDFLALDMAATSHFKQKTTMGDMSSKQLFMETAIPRQYMRNSLFLNTGTGRFREAAFMSGLDSSDWSWAAKAGDFDNDGLVDVVVTNGMARAFTNSDILRDISYSMRFGNTDWDLFADKPPQREANLAFRNLGNLKFEETGNAWGLDYVGMSYSAAQGDLDRDGDLDLIVANLDEPVQVYRNDSPTGHRLLVELQGTQGHVSAMGSRVEVQLAEQTLVRQANPYTGFLSSNDPALHFGLGDSEKVDAITVYWASGQEQTLHNIQADQWLVIKEPSPSGSLPSQQTSSPPARLFDGAPLSDLRHQERPFDDFRRQALLPNKLSQLGPGLAVADVDGNGLEDCYLSGAAGFSGQLLLRFPNDPSQTLRAVFEPDREAEDMSSLFFDANGDGHLDLFVVSGGVECEPGAAVLQDRLYLGDGKGGFVRDAQFVPPLHESGGAAAVADFDRDGDLDVFVGGRSVPGQYPLAPANHLLVNQENQRFENASSEALKSTGMVTSALWSDVDDDGWIDLLLAHEWGPIKLFLNQNGVLVERTDTGIQDLTGWWNSITAGDIDRDGDMDYVAMNVGLNSKYHASAEKPALLYYGDFEGDGRMRLVEAEYEDETLFPVRGRSCSTRAIPHLKDKFESFERFAEASLEEIYPDDKLATSHRFEANTLESGVLLNDGTGRLSFQPLPRVAQIAPAYGVTLTDLDGDGILDLYLLQNFFSPQLETGRMNGGVSQLLTGNGDGTFQPRPPDETGLLVSGDGSALVVLDLNQDHAPDLVATQNNGAVLAFTNKQPPDSWRTLRLQGQAIGARLRILQDTKTLLTAEVSAGGGYLSQSSPVIFFALPADQSAIAEIRWPDGSRSESPLSPGQKMHSLFPPLEP